MPTKNHISIEEMEGRGGVKRSEPGGRAQLDAGARGLVGGGRRGLAPPGAELSSELVDEAVARARRHGMERARLRGMLERPDGGRISDEVIDELLAGAKTEEEIVGPGGPLAQLTKRLVERAMEVELTDHLGYEPHVEPPGGTGNTRNGSTPKTLTTDHGPVRIFDDKILALYSRGL